MKRILRWLLILVLLLLAVSVAVPLFVLSRIHEKPSWYGRMTVDPAAQMAAAKEADRQLLNAIGAAKSAQNREMHPNATQDVDATDATQPSDLITIQLTEQELNAFYAKWEREFGWKAKLNKYARDPVIVLEDHELILAATLKDWNTVLALHFTARVENKKLFVNLANVVAGTLPVPRTYFDRYLGRLENLVNERLPDLRENARIDANGWANSDCVAAAMGELLLHALHDEPAEPALFLPDMMHASHSVPVEITSVDISNKTLTLTVRPMNRAQRDALLDHLRSGSSAPIASDVR